MNRGTQDVWTVTIFILLINFIGFTIVKFNRFKERYHTFYQCNEDNITSVFNGKEFKNYKLKFEKINKMSPNCKRID